MATCCKCKHHFKVMEDEDPLTFNCPKCGYNPYEWGDIGGEDEEDNEDEEE